MRIRYCEGTGLLAVGDEVVQRVTWPRTELRGQVTPPPAPRGIPGGPGTVLLRVQRPVGSHRGGQFATGWRRTQRLLGRPVPGLLWGGTRENFRGALDALLPRITLLERTDSQPTIVSRQTIRPSGPRAAGGPTLQGVADGQRGLGVPSGVPGDRPPRGIASLGEGARTHRR